MKHRRQNVQSTGVAPEERVADSGRDRHEVNHRSTRGSTEQSLGYSAFLFSSSSNAADLLPLHPSPETIFALWQVYLENVDPLVKLFHTPSVQKQVLRASYNPRNSSPALQALMFSVYYAATLSTRSPKQQTDLEEDRSVLLGRYRFGVEQALARAGFLSAQDLTVLQAFVLYLICTRRDSRVADVWALTSLAIRIATRMGLHQDRDGTASTLPHYEIEMRRRLWWQILVLDIRTAEDSGTDPSLYEHMFCTNLPSNVNDADVDPDMGAPPTELGGRTEMLFSIVRFEMSFAARRILCSQHFCHHNSYPLLDAGEKLAFIDDLERRLKQKHLKSCDLNIPLCFLTVSCTILGILKLKLVALLRSQPISTPHSQTTKDILFTTSLNILESFQALKSDEKVQRWVWLFQDYVEWDAMAYLLDSICERIRGTEVDRAWSAVNAVFKSRQGLRLEGSRETRWQHLEKVRLKAIEIYGRMLIEETRRAGVAEYDGLVGGLSLPDMPASTNNNYMEADRLPSMEIVDPVHTSADVAGWRDPFHDLPTDPNQSCSTFWL